MSALANELLSINELGFYLELTYNALVAELRLINDVLFKLVFGEKESEPILRALLNALLGYKGKEKIVSLTIQNPGLTKEFVSDKGSTLDLKAVDGRGQWYNIEVQLQDNDGCEVAPNLQTFQMKPRNGVLCRKNEDHTTQKNLSNEL